MEIEEEIKTEIDIKSGGIERVGNGSKAIATKSSL